MIDVVVELVAAWLGHTEHGMNAIAATLPRLRIDTNDPTDTDDAPPTVPIYTDARDAGVAKDLVPPESPAVIVFARFDEDEPVKNGYQGSKDVTVYASFVTNDGADALTASRTRNALYRAIRASLVRMNDIDESRAFRELNFVQIDKIDRIREERVTEAVGSTLYWGLMEIHVWAIDGVALGAGVSA